MAITRKPSSSRSREAWSAAQHTRRVAEILPQQIRVHECRVHNHVGADLPGCGDDRAGVRRVQAESREPIRLAEARRRTPSALDVHVREGHVVEEGPVLRDRRDGGSDASRADHQHFHSCRGSTIRG